MSIDWDALVLAPSMAIFGEGDGADQSAWPLYSPSIGGIMRLPGAVYDSAYHRIVELADGDQGTTEHPVLGVRAALFRVPPRQGDRVFVPSVDKTYAVADARPDGHGHILLILVEAQ